MAELASKILFASESDGWTGGTAQLLASAERLRARGWTITIACRPGSGLSRHASDRNFPTLQLPMREDYDLVSAWRLSRFIEMEGVRLVHAHHNRSHAVCLLAKTILSWKSPQAAPILIVSRRVSFPPGRNPFSRWKYRSALIDRIVAVADAVKGVLVDAGVPVERVCVIRSGVDGERFAPRAADPALRRALGIPEGRAVIGKIANASPWKGQDVLLRAAARLVKEGHDIHVLLAGRDTNGPWVRGEVERLGLDGRVAMAGFREDVPELLSLLSVSVNAAVRGEGLSGALRESLAMGVPVVASDIAGNRELLRGEAGELFPPGDDEALAGRLRWTLDHLDESRARATAWRQAHLGEFTLDRAVAETDALYRSLLTY